MVSSATFLRKNYFVEFEAHIDLQRIDTLEDFRSERV